MTLVSTNSSAEILKYIKETGGRPSLAQFEEDQGSKGVKLLRTMERDGLVRIENGRVICVSPGS